ncbi:hypothetical protein POM88_028786 [Heracleum sosnowskyi]|uniref:Uncharacterized protein n=1 Tax=Heracleum sosnowskyi TaxID=360622 RepID=A0AAD8HTK3_9APIA|nr:hypothetical protein POM88_028786 [Heracleum sosnowskyi]
MVKISPTTESGEVAWSPILLVRICGILCAEMILYIPPQDTQENRTALNEWKKKNEAQLRVLKDELENATQGNLTISEFFLKVKNLCSEIYKLDEKEMISEAQLKCIIDRGLKPGFIPFVTSIQGWPVQPSLEEYENVLVSVEALAKKRADISNFATNTEEESDINERKQKKVEDKEKDVVMDGCASEESQLSANMTDSPGNDGEELFESDDEAYESFQATE